MYTYTMYHSVVIERIVVTALIFCFFSRSPPFCSQFSESSSLFTEILFSPYDKYRSK